MQDGGLRLEKTSFWIVRLLFARCLYHHRSLLPSCSLRLGQRRLDFVVDAKLPTIHEGRMIAPREFAWIEMVSKLGES